MSENGELIIDRLPLNCELHNTNNPINKLIQNSIGAWLDDFEDKEYANQFFLTDATGEYLDLHGADLGIKRKLDESDDEYRERIIYESLGHITVDLLLNVYGVQLFTFIDDFSVDANYLISDNHYITSYGFLAVTDKTTRDILNKKLILDNKVQWLIL